MISSIIKEMIQKGSAISYSDKLIKDAEEVIKKDYSLEEALTNLSNIVKNLLEKEKKLVLN